MRHRHWLLIAAAVPLFFAYIFIRFNVLLSFYSSYGDADIRSATSLSIALILVWGSLEITHYVRSGSQGRCHCGYSLKGLKCPECGRDLGGQ